MAAYASIPPEKMAKPVKKTRRVRSQKPGYATDEPMGFSETAKLNSEKSAKPTSKRQGALASNRLDKENKSAKVGGKGSPRDSLAPGARKAGAPSPKPKGSDKKVGRQVKK